MPSKAVLMFETALQKALPNTGSLAASKFESLLKARAGEPLRKAKEPTEAPNVAQATPEQLGRGTGRKPDSFEAVHPHHVHGNQVRFISAAGYEGVKAIDESHPDFHKFESKIFKVHNPYERISRMGYQQSQGSKPSELTNYEHPNHPKHLAYAHKLIGATLDPEAQFNIAARSKHAGGQSGKTAMELIGSGAWRVSNKRPTGQGMTEMEMPSHFHDMLHAVDSQDSKHRGHYAKLAAANVLRMGQHTANFNRVMHVMRELGPKAHEMHPDEFYEHVTRGDYSLKNYSQARVAPGFTDDHLKNVKGYNPSASADFNAKGAPTHKPISLYTPRETAADTFLHKVDNTRDAANHISNLPLLDGRAVRGSGMRQLHDYLPADGGESGGRQSFKIKPYIDRYKAAFGIENK